MLIRENKRRLCIYTIWSFKGFQQAEAVNNQSQLTFNLNRLAYNASQNIVSNFSFLSCRVITNNILKNLAIIEQVEIQILGTKQATQDMTTIQVVYRKIMKTPIDAT